MADPPFSELIQPQTADQIEETQLALLEGADLPVQAWKAGSVIRLLLDGFSEIAHDWWYTLAQIARGAVLGTSEGAWVDLRLASDFAEVRIPPVRTVGRVLLTDGGGGPHAITVGVHRFATAGSERVYRVSALPFGGTLAAGGTLVVEVTAEAVGGAYNVPNGAITVVVVSLPTVTVSNPEIGTTGTWTTTLGADVESDAAAKKRAPLKWGTLSTGSPPSAYVFWALTLVAGVTRAKLDDANPDGPGTNRVYIDNAGAVAALQAILQPPTNDGKVPSGTRCTVMAATTQSVALPATITVERTKRTAAEAAILNALTELSNETDIGGLIRKAEIIERIMDQEGVIDVEIGSGWTGTPNVQLLASAIPQFTLALQYIEV